MNEQWNGEPKIFVALSPCNELASKHWTFWKNNALILLPETKSVASELNLNLNSRTYFLDSNHALFELFKYQEQDSRNVDQKIAEVNSTNFLTTAFIWDRRTNLSGIHLNIVYHNRPPYIIKENSTSDLTGIFFEIFLSLHQALAFTFTLIEQDDDVKGSLQSNGSYNGLLGKIQGGMANWSIAEFSFTEERNKVFDFSIPLIDDPKKIVTRQPSEDFDTSSYFIVFNIYFWLVLMILALLLIIFIFCILKFDSIDDKHQSNHIGAVFSFTMLSLICRVYFVQKADWSGKILFLVVMLWGFMISVAYNAILTSVLTSRKISAPINSLEELLNSHYCPVWKASGSTREFFTNAPKYSIGN